MSFARCLCLSPVISTQFTLEMYAAASNSEKNSLKPLFWDSRSFKVIDVGTPRKLVSSASLCLSATVLVIDWSTAETGSF